MTITATVTRIWEETPEIRCLELVPESGTVGEMAPGAHTEVHLPGGFVRQYSLWNGPDQRTSYLIGVKREPQSRGGSAAVHRLNVGDKIEIGALRNNFHLVPSDGPAILLAGGIGITPLLSMARACKAQGRPHVLHLFARDSAHAPFLKELSELGDAPVHLGLVPPTLDKVLKGILAEPTADANLYICGPGPFMDLVERLAAMAGWPSGRVHLERFSIDPDDIDTSGGGFEVILAQSGQTVFVNEGETIIGAMEKAGLVPLTSCEQGHCGTCMATVIEGEPDHRDSYLSRAERESGKVIMPCVSRCKGKRLILDL